jgi:hypothetical protein
VYGATTISATGGRNGSTVTSFDPAPGGTGSGGQINISGGAGTGVAGVSVAGGGTFWGGGDTWTGISAYGSGGGWYTNTGFYGGRDGIVVIEY